MSSSAETVHQEVVGTILALERACLEADAALTEHRWKDVRSAFATQEELTRSLGELFVRAPEASPNADQKVAQRIRGVLVYRDDQLRRLTAYRDEVARRLNAIGKLRELSRSIGKPPGTATFLDEPV